MAKVILVGQDDIQLNRERAKEIKKDWKNDKFNKDDKIEVGDNSIEAGDIRSIRIGKKSRSERENVTKLPTEELKRRLGDFEEKYEEHRSREFKSYDNFGVMDTGIHDWLKENEVIGENGVDPELYHRFSQKKKMLTELKGRREYAEEKDEEYKDQLAKDNA